VKRVGQVLGVVLALLSCDVVVVGTMTRRVVARFLAHSR
jgi:hypothetical protein